jgi:hypothetical protein
MPKVIFPPIYIKEPQNNLVDIFLAGSIEMGNAIDWQTKISSILLEIPCVRYIYNPRRPDFDNTQKQDISNEYFNSQVNWELENITKSNIVFMYLDPDTKSPISLAELGLLIGLQKSYKNDDMPYFIVCCPNGFYRQGNVEIMLTRAGLPMYRNFEDSIKVLINSVITKHKILSNILGQVPCQYV